MTTQARPTRIVIFAKAPIPGFCKTRLIGALGAQGAATLAEHMLLRAVRVALEADLGPVELCVSPDPTHERWQTISGLGEATREVVWTRQSDGDLGARMATAVQRTLGLQQNVICIGTDCLELEVEHLRTAAIALSGHQAAMIPAIDGGYVLLALRQYDHSLFENIAWSTSSVRAQTLARLQQLGWSVSQSQSLRDIDEPGDLAFLPNELQAMLCKHAKNQDCIQ